MNTTNDTVATVLGDRDRLRAANEEPREKVERLSRNRKTDRDVMPVWRGA